jgi:allantoin racemase
MKIWHQSMTVLEEVPAYLAALRRRAQELLPAGVTMDFHGMWPGTYGGHYPADDLSHVYLANLHKEQLIAAALDAERQGYDAFFLATAIDLGYEEMRSLVDIPVVAFGQSSFAFASMLGNRIGLVNFIAGIEPLIVRNLRDFGLADLLGPTVVMDVTLGEVIEAYDRPDTLIARFVTASREVIAAGANVIVPGPGPLNLLLAEKKISRVDEVPVVDSLGVGMELVAMRAAQYRRSGLMPSGTGYLYARPSEKRVAELHEFYKRREWH